MCLVRLFYIQALLSGWFSFHSSQLPRCRILASCSSVFWKAELEASPLMERVCGTHTGHSPCLPLLHLVPCSKQTLVHFTGYKRLSQLESPRLCWSNLEGEHEGFFPQGMWALQRLTEPPGLLALTLHFSTERKMTFSLAARRGPKAGASQPLAKSCPLQRRQKEPDYISGLLPGQVGPPPSWLL